MRPDSWLPHWRTLVAKSAMTKRNGTDPAARQAGVSLIEIGRSGLCYAGGQILEEQLRDLQGLRGIQQYTAMIHDDVAGAVLFAIDQLARQVSWRVEPASQEPDDLERADFVQSCLDDLSVSWKDTVSEALTMLPYGWSYLETIYKRRGGDVVDPTRRSKFTDGKIGLRKLAGRAQDSLVEWRFDDAGGIQAMVQAPAPIYRRVEIPIDKALLFRTTAAKGNPQGRSIFRTAFIPWRYKVRLREIEAIGIERSSAGFPVITLNENAPDVFNPNDPDAAVLLARLEKIVRNVRVDEQMGLVLPKWATFSFVASASRQSLEVGAVIARYDARIAMTALADFILIGHEQVGSFALTNTKTELFGTAMEGFLDVIAETVNRHLMPRLMRLNGWPTDRLPTLAHGDVARPDLTELGNFIVQLAGAGMPLFPAPELERALLAAAKLPLPDETEVAKGARGDAETLAAALRRLAARGR